MSQVQMYDLMCKIIPILEKEFDTKLYDYRQFNNPETSGINDSEKNYFYDISAAGYIELWKPNQNDNERKRIDFVEFYLKPELCQHILDQMRIQLQEWL